MDSRAELRRIERWMEILVPRIFQRVVNGKAPQPGWLPHRWLSVVWADADMDAGIGAVWLVWRPGSANAQTRIAQLERCRGRWEYTGAGGTGGDVEEDRRAAGEPRADRHDRTGRIHGWCEPCLSSGASAFGS